jgi:hypothetical protein
VFRIFAGTIAFLLLSGFSLADWQQSDGSKMHYPQTPDLNGWSVQASSFNPVADDWQCTQTGPVSNIYLWLSWEADTSPSSDLPTIVLDISENDSTGGYDKPGTSLWGRGLDEPQLSYTVELWDTGDMGTYGWSGSPFYQTSDHTKVYVVSIENISDPFTQQAGTVYWLSCYFWFAENPVGWDTSVDSFASQALWIDPEKATWQPLNDPVTGDPMDMAFVITPEPMTITFLAVGAAAVLRRKQKKISCFFTSAR